MSELLKVDQRDGIWTITLTRQNKRNALSGELVDSLLDAVQHAHKQQARVLVFRGQGRNFSAGFDFSDIDTQSEGDLVLRFVRIEMLLQAVATSPCLTVALAHGKNFGAGVDLFAVCRERIASADTTFRMPGLKFGLVLGTRRFGDIVGKERAAQVLEEATTFNVAQALNMGFVHQLVEPDGWGGIVNRASIKAYALDDSSRAALYHVLASQQPDTDMACLVRSAAQPGLKDRVAKYLQVG